MIDDTCRITVVGERRQLDLTVPARAPIVTYVGTLARMCDQDTNDVMTPAWSLGRAVGPTFAPERSLTDLGVVDGQVLYLRDMIADEYAEPVAHDVAEQVAELTEGALSRQWRPHARTVTVLAAGLCWLVATLIVLASRRQVSAAVIVDIGVATGVVLPMLAWVGRERGWPVPPALRTALALSAVPLLALSARMMVTGQWADQLHKPGGAMTGVGTAAAAVVTGTLVGAALAYGASPGGVTAAVLGSAAVAAVLGIGAALLKADLVETSGLVAAVAFTLLSVSPLAASQAVAVVSRSRAVRASVADGAQGDPVATAVSDATRLLVFYGGFLAAALAVTLTVLGASRSPCAVGMDACLAVALLFRAGWGRLIAEVVPVGVAGLAGLLSLLLTGPDHLDWPAWVSPLLCVGVATALIVYGYRNLMRRPDIPPMDRPGWFTGLSAVLGGGALVLLFGLLGVYGHVVDLGHRI